MARRKAIPQSIDTEYFSDVTPLWVPPGRSPIPERYHDAVWALAEWAGEGWSDNDETDFFLIRQVLIQSCEAWSQHDWERDRIWIEERLEDQKTLKQFGRSLSMMSVLAGPIRFKRLKIRFVQILSASLGIKLPSNLKNGKCIDAFDQSVKFLGSSIEHGDNFPAQFGAVEYLELPNRLPQIEVAVALCLADRITFFRKDGHSRGTLHNPHEPTLSPELPWKSIALFASANVPDADEEIGQSNVQTRVENLAKSADRVRWTP